MPDQPTESGLIRPMTKNDLNMVLFWRNHPDVRKHMFTQHEIGIDEHQLWFDHVFEDPYKHLLIYELKRRPLGFVNFFSTGKSGIAEWGFYASPEAPKGVGRNLGQLALNYAFGHLNFHKVCGRALKENERSIRMHMLLGFQQEGVFRDQHFDGERYRHVVCFGLLRTDWRFSTMLEQK